MGVSAMSEQVSALFAQLCELADAEGAVPNDGSGIDGVWSRTIPAQDRERDWTVALNADTEQEHTVEDVPIKGSEATIRAGAATVWLGETPAGVLDPYGGQLAIEMGDDGPQSIEEELIADVEAQIEEVSA